MDELEQLHQQIAELQKKAQEVALQRKEPIIEDMKKRFLYMELRLRSWALEKRWLYAVLCGT